MTTESKKVLLLPIPAANALLEYLTTRPFKEVHQLVASITGAAVGEVQPAPAPAPRLAPPEPQIINGG